MNYSHFWASLLGFYFLIFGIIILFRKEKVLSSVEDFYKSPGCLLLGGIFTLFLGLAIVLTHLVFEISWQGVVTLFGFLAIIKGIMLAAFPKDLELTSGWFLSSKYFTIWVCFILFIGAGLLYNAFL